jgi:hypothetical protein
MEIFTGHVTQCYTYFVRHGRRPYSILFLFHGIGLIGLSLHPPSLHACGKRTGEHEEQKPERATADGSPSLCQICHLHAHRRIVSEQCTRRREVVEVDFIRDTEGTSQISSIRGTVGRARPISCRQARGGRGGGGHSHLLSRLTVALVRGQTTRPAALLATPIT